MKSVWMIILQIIFINFFYLSGISLSSWLRLPIPGSMVGLVLLFVCLKMKIIKMKWVEKGAKWLAAELLLFFIPSSAAGIAGFPDALSLSSLRIIFIILLSTLMVMGVTGVVAEFIHKKRNRNLL
ncbi:CidA/LrgA family protein [Falsibacillus albus]|uniref:CidA/LrgA family protein n=1 Tax=Falsibacillus albus TaxID=2478915 RepID=A0A3L7JXE7_9BACI|nr:CidA/LrgA family protein [Falsibacillus albus]RLQ95413.1 CidA/LrgA family protein [Falsibacillus albus]